MLAGVVVFLTSMVQSSHFTVQSGSSDFFWPLILRGAGLGMLFVPLTNLALAQLPMERIANGTGLFNLTRQLGGSIGIALAATLLTRFRETSRATLAVHLTGYDAGVRDRLSAMTAGLMAQGAPLQVAQQKALRLLDLAVTQQAMMLSYERLFLLFGLALTVATPLLLLMRRRQGRAVAVDVH